jgi:hypothetical protein
MYSDPSEYGYADSMSDDYPDYSGTTGSSGLNENGEPTFG